MAKEAVATRKDIDDVLSVLDTMMSRIDERFTQSESKIEHLQQQVEHIQNSSIIWRSAWKYLTTSDW